MSTTESPRLVQNKAWIFAEIPDAAPVPGKHLVVKDNTIDLAAALDDGAVLVQNLYISLDPYQRARMRDASIKSYFPAFELGSIINNSGIARVVRSASPSYKESDLVKINTCKAEEYSVLSRDEVEKTVKPLDNPLGLDLVHHLGALGMPGATAFSSLYEIGDPKAGETIYISAASGAVGAIVGQIAKNIGLTVIGSVGSDDKVDYLLKDCGFDHAFNYKKMSIDEGLKKFAPNGIDIYFENVGGETLDTALLHMCTFGRIITCGMISQYNLPADKKYGIKNLSLVVTKQLKMQGFIVSSPSFGPKYAARQMEFLAPRLKDGSIKARVDITRGIDNASQGFVGMLRGENFGKAVLEIAPLEKA